MAGEGDRAAFLGLLKKGVPAALLFSTLGVNIKENILTPFEPLLEPEIRHASTGSGVELVSIGVTHEDPRDNEGTRDLATFVSKDHFLRPNGGFVFEEFFSGDPYYHMLEAPEVYYQIYMDSFLNSNNFKEAMELAIQDGLPIFMIDYFTNDRDKLMSVFGSHNVDMFIKNMFSLFKAGLKISRIDPVINEDIKGIDEKTDFMILPILMYAQGKSLMKLIDYVSSDKLIKPELLNFVADLSNPNNFVINMRNIVWALKIHDLYQQGIIPKKYFIHQIVGRLHSGVAYFVANPQLALDYWNLMDYGSKLHKLSFEEEPILNRWVYTSLVLDTKDRKVKGIEHPELKKLLLGIDD